MNEMLNQIFTIQNILIYIAIVNVIGFLAMGMDKLFAKARMWRISEKTLITLTAIGGGIGTTLGMFLFRHKITKGIFKPAFIIITIVEYILIIYMIIKYVI